MLAIESKVISFEEFKRQFKFKLENHMLMGVEDEVFLIGRKDKKIVPMSDRVITACNEAAYSYEPSNCQFEYKIGPIYVNEISKELEIARGRLRMRLGIMGLDYSHQSIAPVDMPMDVYPDTEYQRMVADLSKYEKAAAFRIIGTHFHVGFANKDVALRVYNYVVENYYDILCEDAERRCPGRLEMYKRVKPDCHPPTFATWEDVYEWHIDNDCIERIRSNWRLIRLTVHGTIEFRMYGAMEDVMEVQRVADGIHEICREVHFS